MYTIYEQSPLGLIWNCIFVNFYDVHKVQPTECVWPHYPIPTHSAVDVGLGPDRVVLLVDHLGSAQHVQIFHHVLLYVRQGGNLSEVAWEAGKWEETEDESLATSPQKKRELTDSALTLVMPPPNRDHRGDFCVLQHCFMLEIPHKILPWL